MSATPKEWQVPPSDAVESRKLGWVNEACQEGESWVKSQRGFEDWLNALDTISGMDVAKDFQEYRSRLTGNRLKVNIQVAISGLSAIRPWGGFQSSEPYASYANMMNQTTRALYLSGFWDQDIKSALQWGASTCTGWMRPCYRRAMAGAGHGNIELDTFGMPSILPTQMPSNGDYERAYAVTLMDEKPIWEAHGMFPDFQDRLKPTNSRYWYSKQINTAAVGNANRRNWNPFKKDKGGDPGGPLIPIRYTWINDLNVNTTGRTLLMGEPGSSWSYEVPSFKSQVPAGRGLDGQPLFRLATVNDARMYPRRRLIISSQDCMLYDGPAYDWHGELPLIPFCLDRWPWDAMGYSMGHDGYSIQRAINQIDRGTMDKINADMDRPLAYNMNAVSKREANQVDLMQPRQRIAFDGDVVDKPFAEIAPSDVYQVSPASLEFRRALMDELDYTLQTRDIVELGKARALGKGIDQLEALINASGPRVKDMSRAMEKSVSKLAGQVKYLIFQYMDTTRLIPYANEAGVKDIFDYNPASLIPSHMPGENPDQPSAVNQIKRAQWFAEQLPFVFTPYSIHEIQQIEYRLMLMQMRQRGYPIAACDVMEANNVPDVKHVAGSTTQERYRTEISEELEWKMKLAQEAAGMGIDLASLMGGSSPEGRPPSGQAPPQMKQKGDGRPVITES